MTPFSIIKYQLYLLQLENYEINRYWSTLFKKGFFCPKESLRKKLVWTTKSNTILVTSLSLILVTSFILLYINPWLALPWIVLSLLFLPIFYSLSLLLIKPLDVLVRKITIDRARSIIAKRKDLKIIGIAGSYGKTTMKNVVRSVLSTEHRTISTPESVNTPLGIARWIIEQVNDKSEVLIIEMGEHYKGDIKYLCSITPPDIAILTGINEAHLERMSNIEESISTIFELARNSKKNTLLLLNADDENIINNHKKYIEDKKTFFYSSKNNPLAKIKAHNIKFHVDDLTWNFYIDDLAEVKIPILGQYVIGDVSASILIAKSLRMSKEGIMNGLSKIKPISHRLFPMHGATGVLIIDDSYNGNPSGAGEAINTLNRFTERRKIFLTPGLVETGKDTKRLHENIGKQLSSVADLVILIRNSVTPSIASGLNKKGFNQKNILWFETAKEAHNSLGAIIKSNDVILFQNDWGDQYV